MSEKEKEGTEKPAVPEGLYHKINALRAEMLTKDWSDDKNFQAGGTHYTYLSADKVKKTMAPLLARFGLELRLKYSELNAAPLYGSITQHWTIKLEAALVDTETGDYIESAVYGESGTMDDKGINKAQTCALKQWITDVFLVADGIDPDEAVGSFHGAYHTPEETETVKSKVLANGVKPMPIVKPVEKAPAPVKNETQTVVPKTQDVAPKSQDDKAKQTVSPKTQDVAPETPTVPKPTAAAAQPAFEPSDPQKRAIQHIVDGWTAKRASGGITEAEYQQMQLDSQQLTDQTKVLAFIRNYRKAIIG